MYNVWRRHNSKIWYKINDYPLTYRSALNVRDINEHIFNEVRILEVDVDPNMRKT